MKREQKSKVQEVDFIDISELLSFRNNSELLLRAYTNGNLCAIGYNPKDNSFILDDDPDIETVIKDRAVGFFIKH